MQLSRTVGYFCASIFLFSAIIGAGIFVSPKGVLRYSSLNIPVSLSIWVLCSILSVINGLCNCITYFFLKRSLGSCVAFLNLWMEIFGLLVGLAAQSLFIASYLIQPFYALCPPPELPKKCLAFAILWSLGLLNIQGLTTVSWFQTVSTLVKMAILSFISLTGIVKNPGQTIPRTLISALFIVTVVYLLTNISFLTVLTPKEIIFSDSVAVTWMDRVFPSMQWVISRGISISMVDKISCGILKGSRMLYAASQEGQLPLIHSMLNEKLSPAVAVIQLIIFSSIVVIPSNLTNLIKYLGLVSWVLNGLNMIGLLKLRYQNPDLWRPYKVWLPLIFASLASSVFLILMPIIQSPKMEHAYQVIFVLSGLLYYQFHVHLKQHSVCSETITCYLQLLFNVSPSDDHE
uniref:Solute carrier family 7 member 13-like n=1 Tax=Chinchilla lanigera TaxID=34839 RepID=A0A8C2UZN5_CHILA